MKNKLKLLKIDDPHSIEEFLKKPETKIAEVLTGILASDMSHLKLVAGRLLQASIKHSFITQLGREIKEFIDKGKIKEDYFTTNQGRTSWRGRPQRAFL